MPVAELLAEAPFIQSDRLCFLGYVTTEASEAALRGGLAAVASAPELRRGGIRAAIRALEREASPRLLLVDITGEAAPFEALEALAQVCAPDAQVVVIGERDEVAFYREVTRSFGVTEYLPTPLTRDAVLELLAPLLGGGASAGPAQRGGRVVAVCGARGGAGATTVAVNLALQLAAETRGHVALLDLHLRGGHAALMLGLAPGAGLRTALEQPDRIDALFLERIALPLGERLRVIAAAEPLEAEPRPSPAGVATLLELLGRRFNHIVVDLPMPPGPAERRVLDVARHALVVFGPDLAGLRDAEAAKRLLAQTAGAGRTLTVLNRAGLKGGLPPALVQEALGVAPDLVLPDLPRPLARAANEGKPAVEISSAFRRAFLPLAQEVAGTGQLRRPGLLARMFGR